MNALIIDDDRFVVAALKKSIDWTLLGFEEVFEAYNVESAKNVIGDQHVDLVLSDIDMPHGTGIDLLRWMRDHHNGTPCIFLTNYADFDYAQQAVDLHCFHYFLKPVDYDRLTQVIRDAVCQQQSSRSLHSRQYQAFWHHFLGSGDASGHPYSPDIRVLPAYIRFYPWSFKAPDTLTNLLPDHAFAMASDIFNSVVPESSSEGSVLIEDIPGSDRLFMAIPVSGNDAGASLSMALEEFLATLTDRLGCPANLYLGTPDVVSDLFPTLTRTREMLRNDLAGTGHMLSLKDYQAPHNDFPAVDADVIRACLDDERFNDLSFYCHAYLKKLAVSRHLSARALESFQVDIVQALYSHLTGNGLLAKRLYAGEPYLTLSQKSLESMDYMEAYLTYIFGIAERSLKDSAGPKDIVQIIKDYVDKHYMEDISRESLTDVLYFDPDYASRLFRKQTGISFMKYVTQKRLGEAKKLLKETTMPISTVASKVGYDNFSYFTRVFKKEVGVTPIRYRTTIQDTH